MVISLPRRYVFSPHPNDFLSLVTAADKRMSGGDWMEENKTNSPNLIASNR